MKWLNAYAIVNEIACQKILKKFMKTHFAIKDNVLDKVLATMIEEKHFVKRQNVNKLTHEIKEVVASFYTNNDLKLAEKMLEGEALKVTETLLK